MPCNSDYLAQNAREAELQRAAKLLVYVKTQLGEVVSDLLKQTANDYYAKEDFIPELCEAIDIMSAQQFDRIVYNARSKQARDLADWWEEHVEADRKRVAAELKKERIRRIRITLMNSLSSEEIEALEISDWKAQRWREGKD